MSLNALNLLYLLRTHGVLLRRSSVLQRLYDLRLPIYHLNLLRPRTLCNGLVLLHLRGC